LLGGDGAAGGHLRGEGVADWEGGNGAGISAGVRLRKRGATA